MLLQQIVHQLDGELDRLQTLRSVVAGLAKSPAVLRRLPPRLDQILKSEPIEAPEPVRKARAVKKPKTPRAVERPAVVVRAAKQPAAASKAEPTALRKAHISGPVVVSATALAHERELRASAKAATTPAKDAETSAEVRPEAFARELAARWLTSPAKN